MRFWDASAITPLLVHERSSAEIRALLRDDAAMVAWWGSRVECVSAVHRRRRESALDAGGVREASRRLETLAVAWSEVLPSDRVRAAAERALAVHRLRAADALQLGAALAWRQSPTAAAEVVCLDLRLREAAAGEGFGVVPDDLEARP